VSFGVDPMSAEEKAKGVGIYSTPFCLAKDKLGVGTGSNCAVISTTTYPTEIINALELTWKIPYEIPDDKTEATVTCQMDQTDVNYLTVYQSSVMASGFGSGNCWYNGAPTATPFAHVFSCTKVGKIAAGSDNAFSFQFSISNAGKVFDFDATGSASGLVVPKVKKMTCTLDVKTWSSAASSN
jgi:hypothetical protein